MAFKAKDGSDHTNMMTVNKRNASLAAQGGDKAPADAPPVDQSQGGDDQGGQSQSGPIESNPDAMSAIDQLKQMGYTADDVAQAMQDDQSQPAAAPAPGGSKAPLQIPGM